MHWQCYLPRSVSKDTLTMITAMVSAQRVTEKTEQVHTVLTTYQQLYRVMVNVVWVYPEMFSNFVPHLGGMHLLMSVAGSIGALMANNGLELVFKSAFGGVSHILMGKRVLQSVRAIGMVTEELLWR